MAQAKVVPYILLFEVLVGGGEVPDSTVAPLTSHWILRGYWALKSTPLPVPPPPTTLFLGVTLVHCVTAKTFTHRQMEASRKMLRGMWEKTHKFFENLKIYRTEAAKPQFQGYIYIFSSLAFKRTQIFGIYTLSLFRHPFVSILIFYASLSLSLSI